MGYVKETQDPTERAPNGQSGNDLCNKINVALLDFNPNYKINIHILILLRKPSYDILNTPLNWESQSVEF